MSEPELEYARRAQPAGEAVTRQGGLHRLGVGGHDLAPVDAATELAAGALGNRAWPASWPSELVGSATRFGSALARVSARPPGEAVPARGLTRNRETEPP